MTALPAIELSYGTDMSQDFRVRRVNFGDGFSQRSVDGLNAQPQSWRLVWEHIPDSQAETLRTFFAGLAGTGIIDWTPFGQSTALKWTGNNFSSKPSGTLISDCSVTLTQEFDL
jgi:phage-related protein